MAIELNELIGQDAFLEKVTPYLNMHKCQLSPEGRPAGVFYLMGPTGVGKTFSVQSLAKAIHGKPTNLLMINCAEFQLEHEVAKLVGAPPGYLGHRETQPVFTQQKLSAVASDKSVLSIVLFDEIEKASPSLHRILLGIMDNGTMKLGDGTSVNFQNSMIFMSSNVGSNVVMETMDRGIGFTGDAKRKANQTEQKMQKELSKAFSMEFLNRIDEIISFSPLSMESVTKITNIQMDYLKRRILVTQPVTKMFYTENVVGYLANKAYDPRYGAREVKRTVFRNVQSEVANILSSHAPNRIEKIEFDVSNEQMTIKVVKVGEKLEAKPEKNVEPVVKVGGTPVYSGGGKDDPAVKKAKKARKTVQRSYTMGDLMKESEPWGIKPSV